VKFNDVYKTYFGADYPARTSSDPARLFVGHISR